MLKHQALFVVSAAENIGASEGLATGDVPTGLDLSVAMLSVLTFYLRAYPTRQL